MVWLVDVGVGGGDSSGYKRGCGAGNGLESVALGGRPISPKGVSTS